MSNSASHHPVLIISIGVSGCGKTTLAKHLAKKFGFIFLEADNFHSEENKTHMASGQPLTDAMREPWITSMCDRLRRHREAEESCVLAYSGLRRAHRQRFRKLGYPTLFIHLSGAKEIIQRRTETRTNHFMPSALLDSQYQALEATDSEPDIIDLNVSQSIPQLQQQAATLVQGFIRDQNQCSSTGKR